MTLSSHYKKGDWKAICDICGFQFKASQLKLQWDGLRVCKEDFNPRQPQDFLRGKRDDQSVPWTRPEDCTQVVVLGNSKVTSINWTQQTSGTTGNLRSVWQEGGRWVVVGDAGLIITSDDSGVTWTARTSGVTNNLRSVKYWNGNWWIVGHKIGSNKGVVLKSADAVTWASLSIGPAQYNLVDIGFNDTHLAFIGWETGDGVAIVLRTTDGVSFFTKTIEGGGNLLMEFGYGIRWNSVDSLWGIVGSKSGSIEWFGTSPDLINWTRKIVGVSGEIWNVDHDDTTWIIAANPTKIFTSVDSTSWTRRTESDMDADNPWRITHNSNGVILLSGGFSVGKIIMSCDNGATWALTYSATSSAALMSKAIYGENIWVAVGWSGRIVTGVEVTSLVANTLDTVPEGTFNMSL